MSDINVEENITLTIDSSTMPQHPFGMVLAGPKLHGIRITESQLNYHGSITIDADILEKSGLYPLEFVNIWNKNSGARISTYILPGTRGSGIVCLNGAAARSCQVGDDVIITAERQIQGHAIMTPEKPYAYSARVLTFKHSEHINDIEEILEYRLCAEQNGQVQFNLVRTAK